jgi:Tfp pilus assembly protein PilW
MKFRTFKLIGGRPSPGAATCASPGDVNYSWPAGVVSIAAPGDRRAPVVVSRCTHNATRARARLAFTLVEVIVASALGLLVMGGVMAFMWFCGLGVSGVSAQALSNQRGGNAAEFIQSRARFAINATNDPTGNILTLAFDDYPTNDSDHNGITYDDMDHFERFQFIGINGTNNSAGNKLIYIPDISKSNQVLLIPAGVRNLPSFPIFTVTNSATTIIRFGIVDGYGRDHFQSIDIQTMAVPLNRPKATNIIAILP